MKIFCIQSYIKRTCNNVYKSQYFLLNQTQRNQSFKWNYGILNFATWETVSTIRNILETTAIALTRTDIRPIHIPVKQTRCVTKPETKSGFSSLNEKNITVFRWWIYNACCVHFYFQYFVRKQSCFLLHKAYKRLVYY